MAIAIAHFWTQMRWQSLYMPLPLSLLLAGVNAFFGWWSSFDFFRIAWNPGLDAMRCPSIPLLSHPSLLDTFGCGSKRFTQCEHWGSVKIPTHTPHCDALHVRDVHQGLTQIHFTSISEFISECTDPIYMNLNTTNNTYCIIYIYLHV